MHSRKTKQFIRLLVITISIIVIVISGSLRVPQEAIVLAGEATPTPVLNTDLLSKLQTLAADTDCKLPCFLGLRPRITDGAQLNSFIHNDFALDVQDSITTRSGAINYQMELFFASGDLFVNFNGRNNVLNRMNVILIKSELWLKSYNPFALPVVLDKLGKPNEIYVALQGTNPLSNVVTVVYEDQGVMVQYMNAFENIRSNEPLQICPKLEGATRVEAWLQSPDESKPITDYLEPPLNATDMPGANWTLERLAGIDIDDFMKLVQDVNPCFQTLSTSELYTLGYHVS